MRTSHPNCGKGCRSRGDPPAAIAREKWMHYLTAGPCHAKGQSFHPPQRSLLRICAIRRPRGCTIVRGIFGMLARHGRILGTPSLWPQAPATGIGGKCSSTDLVAVVQLAGTLPKLKRCLDTYEENCLQMLQACGACKPLLSQPHRDRPCTIPSGDVKRNPRILVTFDEQCSLTSLEKMQKQSKQQLRKDVEAAAPLDLMSQRQKG